MVDAAILAGTTVLLDPATVSIALRFRAPQAFTGPDFERLKHSIAHLGGNVQPIKVRPVLAGRYELVFGTRRLQACLELGLPVTAVIEAMIGPRLVTELDASNDDSQVSVYERGCLYEAALAAGYYPSLRRLADALGRDLRVVADAATVAQLPRPILDRLCDLRMLKPGIAKRLATAMAVDPDGVARRLAAAKVDHAVRPIDLIRALSLPGAQR